jgi:hypothetical protein
MHSSLASVPPRRHTSPRRRRALGIGLVLAFAALFAQAVVAAGADAAITEVNLAKCPIGPQGPAGELGKIKVTCELVPGRLLLPKVVCTVEQVKATKTLERQLVRLVHGDKTVASGRGHELRGRGRLPHGRFTLVVGHGKKTVRLPVTVR